jgi:hypothetical protein
VLHDFLKDTHVELVDDLLAHAGGLDELRFAEDGEVPRDGRPGGIEVLGDLPRRPRPVARLVPALVGALFVVIGNVMPRMRPNWWFGVRTPWTLSNDRVWARTHRLAGFSMAAAGLVMIAAALALPSRLGGPVMLAAAAAALVGPAVYSYLTWKREQRR